MNDQVYAAAYMFVYQINIYKTNIYNVPKQMYIFLEEVLAEVLSL